MLSSLFWLAYQFSTMFLSYLVFSAAPCAGDPDYAGGDVFMEAGRGWFTDPEVCIQTALLWPCVRPWAGPQALRVMMRLSLSTV